MDEYTENMNTRTLRVRLLKLLPRVRRSCYCSNGADPRNTWDGWYWPAVKALHYR
jgi:hypothetical protein